MTIGKRQSSVRSSIRAPKFLDKSSGFYGRLEDADETPAEGERPLAAPEDTDMFHEDDGEMLLRRTPSRRSSRWRSLRRKESTEERSLRRNKQSPGSEDVPELVVQVEVQTQEQEPGLVHFHVTREADDQVLIRDRTTGLEEEQDPEEERGRREQEEGIKALKRKSSKNYRKALDRALRRGWDAFITNLYSVTLTPVTSDPGSSPSSPSAKKRQHSSVLAELH